MRIPVTYYDGNPEDRRYTRDFWAWLQHQPREAWLNYARVANWDQAEDTFVEMVRHPDCDRALASWLFWSAEPLYWIERGERPGRDHMLGAILGRCEAGGFADSRLRYPRAEVAYSALWVADAIAKRADGAPFRIPRALCASFDGANPDLPAYDPDTEGDLAEMFAYLDGSLPRSDREALEAVRSNWWWEPALRLPRHPRTHPAMSDVAAIDEVFGEHRASLARIERLRQGLNKKRVREGQAKARRAQAARHAAAHPRQRAVGIGILVVSGLLLLAVLAGNLLR